MMIWVLKSGFNSWNQNFKKCTLFVWSTVYIWCDNIILFVSVVVTVKFGSPTYTIHYTWEWRQCSSVPHHQKGERPTSHCEHHYCSKGWLSQRYLWGHESDWCTLDFDLPAHSVVLQSVCIQIPFTCLCRWRWLCRHSSTSDNSCLRHPHWDVLQHSDHQWLHFWKRWGVFSQLSVASWLWSSDWTTQFHRCLHHWWW